MMRGRLLVVVALLGCGREHENITALPPAPSTSNSASVVEKPLGPPCATPRIVVPAVVDEACWPEQRCDSSLAFAIENCTDAPVRVQRAIVLGPRSDDVTLDFDPPLLVAPRASRPLTFPYDGSKRWFALGTYKLVAAVARDGEDAAGARFLEASFVLADPGLEKAKLECLAHGDDWGAVGMAGTLRCAKVMKDEGKICSDESDCGGYCILEREVPVSATEKKLFGRCSRTKERFGCHAIIGATKDDKGLVPIGVHIPRMCVD